MILYMWGTIVLLTIGVVASLITLAEWGDARNLPLQYDKLTVAKLATNAKYAMLSVPLAPLWPVSVPVALIFIVVKLVMALNESSKPNN